ncbi:hypothetical protein FSP39_013386 [Pinctada imbricata]|uniref:Centrosomal protein of 44 kDa n=1 Tax=Pinctada imbricata TaxID=66713 RepID=A0AA88XS04_PINIB|nr:hypothetical protein FSP39_013386 [Pinctada imbricata]
MATGDLTNNIRKLQKELKKIRYKDVLDLKGLTEGKAATLLPIYHYVFTSYSHAIAELISKSDVELYGKTDMRFMEALYKLLRDMFNYKPPITKEQFFSAGFTERKVIMCTEVLQRVQEKNRTLGPSSKRPTSAVTSVLGQTVGANKIRKSKSAIMQPSSALSTDVPRSSSELSHHSKDSPPQIVNELIQPVSPTSPMTRHLASTHLHRQSEVPSIKPFHDEDTPRSAEVVSLSPRVTKEVLPSEHRVLENPRGFNWAVITPSVAKVKTMVKDEQFQNRGISNMRFDEEEEEEEEEEDDRSSSDIETVNAVTPSHSIMEPSRPDTSNYAAQNSLQDQIGKLTELFSSTQEKISGLESVLHAVQAQPQTDPRIQQILSQIETLTARMVLVENRVSILESKVSQTISSPNTDGKSAAAASAVHQCHNPVQHDGGYTNNQYHNPVPHEASYSNNQYHRPAPHDGSYTNNDVFVRGNSGEERRVHPHVHNTEVAAVPSSHSSNSSVQQHVENRPPRPEPVINPPYRENPALSHLTDTSSLGLSPIRQHPNTPSRFNQTNDNGDDTFAMSNTEVNSRRASTPTHNIEGDTKLILGESMSVRVDDTVTQEQVDRIKNLYVLYYFYSKSGYFCWGRILRLLHQDVTIGEVFAI